MKKNFTSVVIVNYKTKELTRDCVNSVVAHFTPLLYEVIVVDNNSQDGSSVYLQELFPDITVIANEKNVGFGAANNIGVGMAAGQYILLLNSDTIVINNILSKFIEFYEKHKHLKPGVVGSLLLSADLNIVHSFGSFPYYLDSSLKGVRRERNLLKQIETNYYAEVDIVVGADMFMEKSVFNSFGGFDTNIFLYEEELELQYRMKKSGYASLVLNEKDIIHLEGQSSTSYFKRKWSLISLCYILKKHHPYYLYLFCRLNMVVYALIFFKNPMTSWEEKVNYLKLSIFKK